MMENYYDAIAIVRHFKKLDVFITMTCNPQWLEIQETLKRDQILSDRLDLISRVFELKFKELMNDIKKNKVFSLFLHSCGQLSIKREDYRMLTYLLYLKSQ